MNKIALFIQGVPNPNEDKIKYEQKMSEDYLRFLDIAKSQGYEPKTSPSNSFLESIDKYSKDSDFFFYYTGHATESKIEYDPTQKVFDKIGSFLGKKFIVLDSCAVGRDFKKFEIPKNSKVISGDLISLNKGLSKILYDLTIYHHLKFEDITRKELNQRGYYDFYFRERN